MERVETKRVGDVRRNGRDMEVGGKTTTKLLSGICGTETGALHRQFPQFAMPEGGCAPLPGQSVIRHLPGWQQQGRSVWAATEVACARTKREGSAPRSQLAKRHRLRSIAHHRRMLVLCILARRISITTGDYTLPGLRPA